MGTVIASSFRRISLRAIAVTLADIGRDRRGAYSMITALLLPVLAGFTALGTETGLWVYQHQRMQGSADAAAISAAIVQAGGNTTGIQTEGQAVAAQNGFTNGTGNVVVTVNNPPKSGPNTGKSSAVEVIISQPQQRLFSALFLSTSPTIAARAVATATAASTACILGLDTSASGTINLSNNALLPDKTCGVASNSSSASGVTVSNNASISGPVISHGGISTGTTASLKGNPNLTNAAPLQDPYASVDPGTPPACTTQNGTGSNNITRQIHADVTVGGVGMTHFCSGLNFTNNITVNFDPGVYFIDSQLVFGNNAIFNGTGVTLVINGNYAISINNNAQVNLSAPTSGPTAGIAFMGSRTGTSTVHQSFSNNTVLNLTGAIYFPNQIVDFDNNATTSTTGGCTQVIGRMVTLANNVDIQANCAGTGVKPVTYGGGAALVE